MLKYIFLVLLVAFSANAAEDIRAHDMDGKPFVCFDVESAQKLLQLRLDVPKLESELQKCQELVTIKAKMVTTLEGLNDNLEDQKVILTKRNAQLQEQLKNRTAWWNNSYLWLGLGVVAGASLTTGIVYAVHP